MPKNRTRRGIPFRSTIGMRSVKPEHPWILVADRHRACLFERTHNEAGLVLSLKEEILHPEGRMRGHELVADRPGRSFESQNKAHHGQAGGTRHAYEGPMSPTDHAVQTLVTRAARAVRKRERATPGFRLRVVAEPKLMGKLRHALEEVVPLAKMTFMEKDYAWLNGRQIKQRLDDVSFIEEVM